WEVGESNPDTCAMVAHLPGLPDSPAQFGKRRGVEKFTLPFGFLGSPAEGSPSLGSNPLYLLRGIC
ncbi:hypothetical protein, partial [uncultured Duncaniella sp.]|uniref:hypothetical protein n=1 Tax=uncultured Duncaniella sp. TaxID=2768039 RepID=UPI0025B7A3F1